MKEFIATSALVVFHAGSLSWMNWNFLQRKKNLNPEKHPQCNTKPTTNSTHIHCTSSILNTICHIVTTLNPNYSTAQGSLWSSV